VRTRCNTRRFTGSLGPRCDAGSAYVFLRSGTTWSLQQQLTASDAAASDNFGSSVALAGDTALVGAPNDDTAQGTDAGSVHVFGRSGTAWSFTEKLAASGAKAPNYFFGTSVALNLTTALVGAPNDPQTLPATPGWAYVFVTS
jgi:hypothetical protein